MQIICTHTFGNCKPGDIREIPDGATFSILYFEEHKPEPLPLPTKEQTRAAKADQPKDEAKSMKKDVG